MYLFKVTSINTRAIRRWQLSVFDLSNSTRESVYGVLKVFMNNHTKPNYAYIEEAKD
jgi:hypothetical protein